MENGPLLHHRVAVEDNVKLVLESSTMATSETAPEPDWTAESAVSDRTRLSKLIPPEPTS